MANEMREQADGGLLMATFMLGEAAFGIDAHEVHEVVKVGDITPVHDAPAYVVGIRNLRGRIVTVIDLCVRLELGSVTAGPENRIFIIDWQNESIGFLVDSVTETISVNPEDMSAPPANLHGVQSRNLRGVCSGGERLVALLDSGSLLLPDDRSTHMS